MVTQESRAEKLSCKIEPSQLGLLGQRQSRHEPGDLTWVRLGGKEWTRLPVPASAPGPNTLYLTLPTECCLQSALLSPVTSNLKTPPPWGSSLTDFPESSILSLCPQPRHTVAVAFAFYRSEPVAFLPQQSQWRPNLVPDRLSVDCSLPCRSHMDFLFPKSHALPHLSPFTFLPSESHPRRQP